MSTDSTPPSPLSAAERAQLLEQYRNGYAMITAALDGISDAELDACEAAGEWSPREVVHHLADSEMTSSIRFRLLVAEDSPMIKGYDQEEFARQLFYDRPIEASLAAFRYARETAAEIAERLSDEQWQRRGTHSESGSYGLEDWLRIYAEHAIEHADQIQRARRAASQG